MDARDEVKESYGMANDKVQGLTHYLVESLGLKYDYFYLNTNSHTAASNRIAVMFAFR